MRCCVPFCRNTTDNVSTTEGQGTCEETSFHRFPSEMHLRAAWLRALGKQADLPDSAVVCSQHFLNDDIIYETESGVRQIRTGAIPSAVQVCMICLDTDSKLLLMSKHKLEEAYENLTGQPVCDQGNLKQTLCVQCAQRLMNFSRFRDKSLRARALTMELVEKHELVTRKDIKMINRTKHQLKSNMVLTTLGPDHCDLHIDVDLLKSKSVPFQCTFCLEEFDHEHVYIQHTCLHLQESDSEAECETSQVCSPRAAGSSSSAHSSLVTENKQSDPSPSGHSAQTLVAPLPASLAANNETKVPPTEESDLQSKTDCLNNVINIQCNDLSTNSSHIEERGFICDICKKMYKRKSFLVKHIKAHVEVSWFTCNICHYKCKNQGDFKRHMITHTGEKPFACKLCDYKCTININLVRHMRTHTGERPFSCKLCDYKCAQNSHLVTHMRTHTGERPFSCKLCDYKCAQNSHLVTHMRTHTGERPFSCKLCNYKCAGNSDLVRHMRTHTGERPFSCKLCDYKCAQNSHLVTHMRTHTGERPFSCKLCNYKCAGNSDLVRHMRTHTGERPFSCKLCNYKCAGNSDLVRHMRTHTGERPFSCKLCDYKCAQNSHLVTHMRTHTGERPFSCKLCNYKCAGNSDLVRHMRTHTGERPFSCKLCNYKCAGNSDLVRHMRTHTGERPFSCKLCDYKCAQNGHLMKHMRTHTAAGEKPSSCS
ncbi:zinc finger protein ZFP2-like isoform X4 [Maniola hyperantus]|uniref:zinc finger protein ZFP2-like isoform X4 n=1 Tax=Aphantopus hyperantus TaxID=2795564 RepID=UPI003748E9AA